MQRHLLRIGYDRVARQTWQQHGRSDKWITQRMTGQETRNKLTDYWREHDIEAGSEFAILNNIIHHEWAGVSVAQHKDMKGLKSHNLRDHMSEAELIFTALAELSSRQIAESVDATGMSQNKAAARSGGRIARQARNQLEDMTGKSVVTGANYLAPAVPKVAHVAHVATAVKPAKPTMGAATTKVTKTAKKH